MSGRGILQENNCWPIIYQATSEMSEFLCKGGYLNGITQDMLSPAYVLGNKHIIELAQKLGIRPRADRVLVDICSGGLLGQDDKRRVAVLEQLLGEFHEEITKKMLREALGMAGRGRYEDVCRVLLQHDNTLAIHGINHVHGISAGVFLDYYTGDPNIPMGMLCQRSQMAGICRLIDMGATKCSYCQQPMEEHTKRAYAHATSA